MSNRIIDDGQSENQSNYLKYVLLFGIVFTALQVSDLTLTQHSLKNPNIRELNPLYDQDWFVPFKLTMVFLIMGTMYRQPGRNQGIAKKAMSGIIIMYLFINLNNLYFVLSV
ncbi:MAG: DUF5658 family protein [Candidatus Methanoperedens sp.]|nr:DUF5658 family protein [Candidatus Methanoperedens sp.]MCZ7370657.1 DUF5658 family protein [Candidatus Methanoperedens sp.]